MSNSRLKGFVTEFIDSKEVISGFQFLVLYDDLCKNVKMGRYSELFRKWYSETGNVMFNYCESRAYQPVSNFYMRKLIEVEMILEEDDESIYLDSIFSWLVDTLTEYSILIKAKFEEYTHGRTMRTSASSEIKHSLKQEQSLEYNIQVTPSISGGVYLIGGY